MRHDVYFIPRIVFVKGGGASETTKPANARMVKC